MALRWKKDPSPKGLARICAGPRGSTLRLDGDTQVATVRTLGWPFKIEWFWVAGWGHPDIPRHNSCDTPSASEAEAKAEATKYVKGCLERAKAQRMSNHS